jgi:hypothetical protein
MSEDKRQGSDPQLDPEMVAEFRAYGRSLEVSRRVAARA